MKPKSHNSHDGCPQCGRRKDTRARRCVQCARPPFLERFWNKVNKCGPLHPKLGTQCWEWTGRKEGSYGRTWTEGQRVLAHRVAWQIANGPVLDGLCVLHHCDNPPCVRPDHLFLGTLADNNADRTAKGRSRNTLAELHAARTHCPQGHPYSGSNLRLTKHGGRLCRACISVWDREYKQKRRQRRAAA